MVNSRLINVHFKEQIKSLLMPSFKTNAEMDLVYIVAFLIFLCYLDL